MTKPRFAALAALLVALILFAGNFHVFTGVKGARVVPRVTFSFSEFLVNEDSLKQMPPDMLVVHYPLSYMALKRDADAAIEDARRIMQQ